MVCRIIYFLKNVTDSYYLGKVEQKLKDVFLWVMCFEAFFCMNIKIITHLIYIICMKKIFAIINF
jgi:hypothetical protein